MEAKSTQATAPEQPQRPTLSKLINHRLSGQFLVLKNTVRFTGPPIPPAANERPAYQDTVKALPGLDADGNVTGLVTRIIAKFDLPTGTSAPPGRKFRYVYHCHILEHEDNEMMRPYDLVG